MARERRKARNGRVIKNTMDKTVVVAVEWRRRHLLYKKSIRRVTKFYVHDGQNLCRIGDLVHIEETRPISRLKRWRVERIIERKEVADIRPIDLEEVGERTAPEVLDVAQLGSDDEKLEMVESEEDQVEEPDVAMGGLEVESEEEDDKESGDAEGEAKNGEAKVD